MKKYLFTIISFILLITTIIGGSYIFLMKKNVEKDIKQLQITIDENNNQITNKNNDKTKLETEHNELKKELKDKVDEYNIWLNLKEKLTK